MRLQDYPRPPDDNGIGMHWSSGFALAVGASEVRKRWIPELQRMGVKWVKFLHDGGLDFAEILLEAGIMPVVRLYRHTPNSTDIEKGTLSEREILAAREMVAAGVRYFEFNNEPELHTEWEGGQVPENAFDYVAKAAIRDMDAILSLGGYPGIPATAIGNRMDLLAKIIEHGGRSLLDGPVWMAIHNYDINHPLDYPGDAVNQQGTEISAQEYDRMGIAAWSGRTWGFRNRDFVNQQRRQGVNTGKTVLDDPSCFLAYARFAELCKQHLGRYLPLLGTESGPIVGEDDDPRYPTTTPQSHAEKVVEQARIIMGTSERFAAAPPYYFCTAFWLIANAELRGTGWEEHAWYSGRWTGGKLPAVDALAALPKVVRPIPVVDGEEADGEETPDSANSMIAGVVYGYPNVRVILRSTEFSAETMTDERGVYRFANLPAGTYRVSVPEVGLVQSGLIVDGGSHLRVDFETDSPPPPDDDEQPPKPAWSFKIEDGGRSPGFGVLRVSVEEKFNLPVLLSADGWAGQTLKTGSKPEYGAFFLEFAPLGPGKYLVTPAEIGISAEVTLDGSRIVVVRFTPATDDESGEDETTPETGSTISGTVTNGAGYTIVLRGPDFERSFVIGADEAYSFGGLPEGTYGLSVLNSPARRSGLVMDGINSRIANFVLEEALPAVGGGIRGRVPGGAGLKVILQGPDDLQITQLVSADERFYFSDLAAGDYVVTVDSPQGEISEGVTVVANQDSEVVLELPQAEDDAWRYTIEDGGPGPGYAIVRVRVAGRTNLPVRIRTTGWGGMLRFTGEKPEYGEFVCDFAPLGSGLYMVEPEGLGILAEVPADGSRVVLVTFSQGVESDSQETPVPKSIDFYLLVGSLPEDRTAYLAVLNYASLFRPVMGVLVDEAKLAQHVIILGNERAISADVVDLLVASGSTVERLYGADLIKEFQRRQDEGKPY
ncbi:MAG: carboxypeptidase regulatory-like domain-containing protein [Caldilineales bacterium]|nr:carboxypeptidase regulatory-like domain-containing protein [Caldilineales bacterium]